MDQKPLTSSEIILHVYFTTLAWNGVFFVFSDCYQFIRHRIGEILNC